ncbi:MAG: DUF2076 domain-containing protein [Pseudomonadota bacterium]|jgi:hypothetical protein
MTPQERQLIDDLFNRLAGLENAPRDPEAEKAIIEGLRRAPNAAYALVQTVLVQDEALKRANAHIEELERNAAQPAPASGSFLDSMRDAVFGQGGSRGSVPNVRPADPAPRPVWNSGQVLNNAPAGGYADPRAAAGYAPPPGYGAAPGYSATPAGGGSSFLGTAAAAAAGVIGGSLLMNSMRGLMGGGGSHQAFSDAGAFGGGSGLNPWGGNNDQSSGSLARDAGLDDIGRGGNDQRQGLFDQNANDRGSDDRGFDNSNDYASNDDDNDDGGFDSDDGGGSDYA